jgi:hypothetical protein
VCSEPLRYDPFCEHDGLCGRIQCTGERAGWVMNFRLQQRVPGNVDYDRAIVETAWADGDDGITFVMRSGGGRRRSRLVRRWAWPHGHRLGYGDRDLRQAVTGGARRAHAF